MSCTALPAGFPEVYDQWQELMGHGDKGSPFLTPQWQWSWWEEADGEDAELRLFLVGPERSPLGLAPLTQQGDRLEFLGDTDLFDYHDFILGPGEPADFYTALERCLRDEPWQTLDLRSVPEGSPTLRYLPGAFEEGGCRVAVELEDVAPGVSLPGSWEEYLTSLRKKDRHELRRKLRRLGQAGGYRLVQSGPDTHDADVATLLELMREQGEKSVFLTPQREAFFRRVTAEMRDLGYLRLFFLELLGQKVAASLCFDFAGRRLLYNSGYRLEYGSLTVGLMLKVLCLQQAIENGLLYFDCLRGAEPYKYHLGAQDVRLYRLVVQRQGAPPHSRSLRPAPPQEPGQGHGRGRGPESQ